MYDYLVPLLLSDGISTGGVLRMKSKQNSIIYHHPAVLDARSIQVASRVRPQKMLAALRQLGYDVDVVAGTIADRARQIAAIAGKIKAGKQYEFLYSENINFPLLLTTKSRLPLRPWVDYRLFATAKKAGIPQGVFYRDIYWEFPEHRAYLGFLKHHYARLFYLLDLWMYQRYFDVIFIPAPAMLECFPMRLRTRTIALPAGARPWRSTLSPLFRRTVADSVCGRNIELLRCPKSLFRRRESAELSADDMLSTKRVGEMRTETTSRQIAGGQHQNRASFG